MEVGGRKLKSVEQWLGTRAADGESPGRLAPGTDVGDWRVVAFIGAGLSSEVYRVRNVRVNGEPLDPEKTYTLASNEYVLLNHGDGYTMFDGCPVLQDSVKLDNQVLLDYITDTLGGVIGEEYADPYGQGRIVAAEAE